MPKVWMHNLPDILSGMPDVWWYPGWELRSRSSGGFDGVMGLIMHHAADSPGTTTPGYARIAYETHPDRPVGNFYIARSGTIVVGAAGASNCAGKGGPWTTSKGSIPLDGGNARTISIEVGNNGVGESWPQYVQDRYIELVARLCNAFGLQPETDVCSHFEWAITDGRGVNLQTNPLVRSSRKIDPAGPAKWSRPPNVDRYQRWRMNDVRADIRAAMQGRPNRPDPQPLPPNTASGDKVIRILGSYPDPNKPEFAHLFSQEFYALFYAECDAEGRSIELQWSGDGRDPKVMERLSIMQANFGNGPGLYGSWPVSLAGVRNNALHPKNRPSDIIDGRKGTWSEADFAV